MAQVTYGDALRLAHLSEMRRDPDVMVMGLDVAELGGVFGVTSGLFAEFGADRVMNFPVSEAGYIGAGIGLAIEGFRPIVELQFADFVTLGVDQIVSVAAKEYMVTSGNSRVPLVIRLPFGASSSGSGYMGGAGPCHSQSPEAWFCATPGLVVVMPSTPRDALGLLKAAIRSDDPVIFMEQKGMYATSVEEIDDPESVFIEIGTAAVVRPGEDLTIVATGATVPMALDAAAELATKGFSVEVIDPRTLVPLDFETILASVAKTGKLLVTHEAHLTGGFGAEVVARVADEGFGLLRAPIRRVTALDMPIPAGPASQRMLPSSRRILEVAETLLTSAPAATHGVISD